jgi:type IV pilus assembly protein PilM
MANTLFGLDIGTSSIKAVWLSTDKNEVSFHACGMTPTPVKGMNSESSLDQEEMAIAVKKVVTDAKIKAKDVSIALPDNMVFTKVVDMPVLSEKELSSAIYWEAEQYIPAQLSTMTLDWRVLRNVNLPQEGERMQVLLVAASTALIKRYQDVLELAGLRVVSVETEVLSVIRAVVPPGVTDSTVLVVNIGALSTSLAIVQKGTVVFTYSVPLGGTAINRAIASDFGFSMQQAEEYKKVYGIVDQNLGGKIGKAITPILSAMLSEVKKAMLFYNNRYKNESPVNQIILSGGSAQLPGIDLFFVQNVGLETAIANPWKAYNVKNTPQQILNTGAAEYTIAFGLALKGYE